MSLSIINDNNNSNSNININNISSNGALSAPTMVSGAEFCCPINPFNSVSEQRESTNIHPIECQSNKTNDAGKLCDHKQPSSGKTSSRKGEFKTTFYNPFETKHRRRTSRAQFEILEAAFEENPKPSAAKRSSLAQKLSMTPRGVQIWFQNRRAKAKQQQCQPNNQHDETRKRSSVRPSTKPLYTEWDSQEPLKRSVTDDGRNGITHVISSPGTCDGTDPAKTQTIHDNALTSLEEQPLTPELVPSISDPWQQPQPVYTTPTWEADQVWYENTNEMQQQEFLLPPYCDNETGNQRHRQPSNQNYAVPIIDPSAIVPDVIYEQPLPDWQAMQPPCSSDFVQSNCHMRRKTNESGYSDDFEFSGDLLSLPAAVHDGVANINNKDLFIVGFAEDQESPVGNFSTSTHIVLPRYDPYYFVTSPLGVSYS